MGSRLRICTIDPFAGATRIYLRIWIGKDKMNGDITIVPVNLRGAQLSNKRTNVLNSLKRKRCSIYFLQETCCTEKEENYITAQWGYECYFNSYNSQSRGVAVMLNNNFEFTCHQITRNKECNKVILDITINGKIVMFINILRWKRTKTSFLLCFQNYRT